MYVTQFDSHTPINGAKLSLKFYQQSLRVKLKNE